MKLGAATKLGKRNTAKLGKFDDDFMLGNCDVMVFFPSYGQFATIRKPFSGRMVYETYIFFTSDHLSYKTWKQN